METPFASSIPQVRRPSENVRGFVATFTRRLLLVQAARAIVISIIALLCGACIVLAIDWVFDFEEAWRWVLTFSVYLGAFGLAWRLGLNRIFLPPSADQVAWVIEQMHPSLREGLLACVELRGADGTTRSGSPCFLDAIERNVAHELSYLEIKSLLPWKPVYQSGWLVAAIIWGIVIACFIPNTGFAFRFAKAMIPFVSFDGIEDRAAWKKKAGIPKVLAFHTEVVPPSYAGMTNVYASAPRGDLRVLKGSRLKLDLDVNQSVGLASIAIEYSDTGRKENISLTQVRELGSIPMAPDAVQRYTTDFLVDEDISYEVRLTSDLKINGKRTENTYSPRYRINALEDTPPTLTWLANEKTLWREPPNQHQTLLVARNAILNLSISITDNLPVDTLVQEVSISRGPWQATQSQLAVTGWSDQAKQARIAQSDWTWDLNEWELRSGDSIATRVLATDRQGNAGYSPTLQLSLAEQGFDHNRHNSLLARSKLVPLLESLSDSLLRSRETLRPKMERLREHAISMEECNKVRAEIQTVIEISTKAGQEFRSAAESTIKDLERCVDQADIELATRLVARIEREWLSDMRYSIGSLETAKQANPDPQLQKWIQDEHRTKVERLTQSYDLACDNAKRGAILLRQFIGLELQAALTRDLTELRDHQQGALNRDPTPDFADLSRTCKVKVQYLNSIEKLATTVGTCTTPELQNRLAELHSWIDQTRTESSELGNQDESEQSAKELRNRIERTVEDLKRVRWIFHLQDSLVSDVINGRKELLVRAGSLWPSFSRFLQRQAVLRANSTDRTLSTDLLRKKTNAILDEVNGPVLTALSQMLDRRDIHQRRRIADSQFASDMGMAFRAWTRLVDRMNQEPNNSTQLAVDSEAIAKAYRILESVHETVEARLVVQSLVPIEQYDWKTLEAQLWTSKQWDSIPLRIELAHQWMIEAGFPNAIADQYNSLRWSEASKQISTRLNPRKDSNGTNLVSIADDLRSVLLQWASADLAAKSIVDEARATLAKFSPTVSQLAKQAIESTELLQRAAEQMDPDNGERPIPPTEQFQSARRVSERQISQLQDVLIENANKQNILNEFELETARDSDRSLKLLDTVLPIVNDALNELDSAQNKPIPTSSEFVREASKAISKTIDALEKVSSHFSKLEELVGTGQRTEVLERSSSDLLKSSQADTGGQRREAENYQRAEELAELASGDTETLLKKLELELKRNTPMQKELSEISKANMQSLATELQLAAKTEDSLARELENADAMLFGEKRMRLDQLRAAAEQTDRLATRMLDQSQQSAQGTGSKEQAVELSQSVVDLRRISQRIRTSSDDMPRSDLESTSKQMAVQVRLALKQVSALKDALKATVEQRSHKEENSRQNARTAAQNIQNESRKEILHHAKELVSHSQRQLDLATKRVQKAQLELDSGRKDRQAAQELHKKEPLNEYISNQLQQMTKRVEQAFVKRKWDEQIRLQVEATLTKAIGQLSALEVMERVNLDRPNPAAALAVEQLDRAGDQLTQIQNQIAAISDSVKQMRLLQAPSSTLSNHTTRQQQIQDSVLEISRQIARSVRHEERLGNANGAEKLGVHAESVEGLATGIVDKTKQLLAENEGRTELAEQQQADAKKFEEVSEPFTRSDSTESQRNLAKAFQELSAESQRIQDQMASMMASQSPDRESALPKGSVPAGQDDELLAARDMARMLDVLDRQRFANASSGLSSKAGPADEDRNGARSVFMDAIKSKSEKLAGQMGQGRTAERSESQSRMNDRKELSEKRRKTSQAERDLSDLESGDFVLPGMTRTPNRDWGKLREQRTQDAVEGRRDEYDPEFEESIMAYYRALGNH